jgi:hypothetical protein
MAPLSSIELESAFIDVRNSKETLSDGSIGDLRRIVTFAARDNVIDIPCHSSKDTWLSKEEIQHFKVDNARSIQMILSGKHRKIPDFSERGLENMSKAGALQVRSRRTYAQRVVLEEQETQRQDFFSEPERIADEYNRAASRSVLSAIARGRHDAQAVD